MTIKKKPVKNDMEIIQRDPSELKPYRYNSRKHSDEQIERIAKSLQEFGWTNPVLIDSQDVIVAGHARVRAALSLGMTQVPTVSLVNLTPAQIRAYVVADNRLAELSEWDMDVLKTELEEIKIDFDLSLVGFEDFKFLDDETTDDDFEVPAKTETNIVLGDLIEIGEHRLMCGDSTNNSDVSKLMNGELADLASNDPPYGMGKEKDGVLNDNLNFNDLLEFNRSWIPLQWSYLKSNGSWYCWGTDEPLMDIYSEIMKPYIANNKMTFRNLIIWDKGNGQGQNSELTRSFAIADEKCLFIMMGVQGFNNNADNYFEGWEPIRNYLLNERIKAGWDIPTMKKIAGHSELSRDHWTCKSQWSMPTKEVYTCFQKWCIENKVDAFKKEYEELKKEHYSTRAYFDNTHDNFNNVWKFDRHLRQGDEGGHATPKPIPLCVRAIKTSCPEQGLVIDFFLGSGSTMVACQQLNRKCYAMELSPEYCQVIINRMIKAFPDLKIMINGIKYND